MKPMKNIFFVFILLIATSAIADGPTTVYGWVSSDGVESFTDNDKAVPAKYLEDVEVITLNGIKGYEKFSVITESVDQTAWLAHLRHVNTVVVEPDFCKGHILVTSQRIQVGDYNRRIYVVTDECGKTTSVTSYPPNVQINR
jgi:hypothetical protein